MEYVSRVEVVETVIMLHNSKNAREKKDFISVEASSIRLLQSHQEKEEQRSPELLSKVFLIIIISISALSFFLFLLQPI